MESEALLRLGTGLSSARDFTGVSGHRQRLTSGDWALMNAVRPPLPFPPVCILKFHHRGPLLGCPYCPYVCLPLSLPPHQELSLLSGWHFVILPIPPPCVV